MSCILITNNKHKWIITLSASQRTLRNGLFASRADINQIRDAKLCRARWASSRKAPRKAPEGWKSLSSSCPLTSAAIIRPAREFDLPSIDASPSSFIDLPSINASPSSIIDRKADRCIAIASWFTRVGPDGKLRSFRRARDRFQGTAWRKWHFP